MSALNKQLKIASSENNLIKVIRFVEANCDLEHINEILLGKILVAVDEAVRNSILHGNKENIRKKVTISFQRIMKSEKLPEKNGISFSVEDEGEGFDLKKVPLELDKNRIFFSFEWCKNDNSHRSPNGISISVED